MQGEVIHVQYIPYIHHVGTYYVFYACSHYMTGGIQINRARLLKYNWHGPSGQFRGRCGACTSADWGLQGDCRFAGAPVTPPALRTRQQILCFRGDPKLLPTLILDRAFLAVFKPVSKPTIYQGGKAISNE
jgi:hypothetical protein